MIGSLLRRLRRRGAPPPFPMPDAWAGRWTAALRLAERADRLPHRPAQIRLRLHPRPVLLVLAWHDATSAHARLAAEAEIQGWLRIRHDLPRDLPTTAAILLAPSPAQGLLLRIGTPGQALQIALARRPDGTLEATPEGWHGPGVPDR